MIRTSLPKFLALLFCLLLVGCSDPQPSNMTENASQEDIDNYNKLIEQANQELAGDSEAADFEE